MTLVAERSISSNCLCSVRRAKSVRQTLSYGVQLPSTYQASGNIRGDVHKLSVRAPDDSTVLAKLGDVILV